jgi:hypothetical protein
MGMSGMFCRCAAASSTLQDEPEAQNIGSCHALQSHGLHTLKDPEQRQRIQQANLFVSAISGCFSSREVGA